MSFSASSVHAAATMALVEAMAGMMFFTTPPVSCQVTPCATQGYLDCCGGYVATAG